MKLYIPSTTPFLLWSLVGTPTATTAQHEGVGAANTGCPFMGGFVKNGASPGYVAQQHDFAEVTCLDDESLCETPGNGNQGLQTNVVDPCTFEVAPEGMTCDELVLLWTPACQDDGRTDFSGYSCGCQSDGVQDGTYCQRSCALCSPVFVNHEGYRSGSPLGLEPISNLAIGIQAFQDPLPRVPCEPYDVAAVADAVRAMNNGNQTLDVPPTVRMGFHDACDYNKWAATGGADGRFVNDPESWYAQSRTVNGGIPCANRLLGYFNDTSLSKGDAVHICAQVATELAGGPSFADFEFEPGRITGEGVASDGTISSPLGNNNMLRDFFYRASLDDLDIVAISGAHTLGGGQGDLGSGFVGDFTPNPGVFSNDYFIQLLEYENVKDYNCSYFEPGVTPADRANFGCHPTGDTSVLLQLPSDRALLLDDMFRSYVVAFANNQTLFFEAYAKSIKKMSELGRDVSVQWCDYTSGPSSSSLSVAENTVDGGERPASLATVVHIRDPEVALFSDVVGVDNDNSKEKRSADIATVDSNSDSSSSSSNTWVWIPTVIASVVSSLMD